MLKSSDCGGYFAFGSNDVFIRNSFCSASTGKNFKHPLYGNENEEAKSFLAGSYEFQIEEIEV